MTSESKAGSEKPARSIELIVRDLRGLLTPLDRQFDEIDQIILSQLLDELDAKRERDKEHTNWLEDCRKVTNGHIKRHGGKAWPIADQVAHAHSEVSEVYQALRHGESRGRVLEEMADSVYSAITLFHIYGATDEEIMEALGNVLWKIAKRADVHQDIQSFKVATLSGEGQAGENPKSEGRE